MSFAIAIYAKRLNRTSGGWFILSLFISPLICWIFLLASGTCVETTKPLFVHCVDCKKIISRDHQNCPKCGWDQNADPRNKIKTKYSQLAQKVDNGSIFKEVNS